MKLIAARNIINVRPGERCFLVGTNLVDYFEIGQPNSTAYWLVGARVGPDLEFVFNGRLFVETGDEPSIVIDNFPKNPPLSGWRKIHKPNIEGFDLARDSDDRVIFGYEVIDNVCHVTTNIYNNEGVLVAETTPDNFLLHRGPALLGRGGIRVAG